MFSNQNPVLLLEPRLVPYAITKDSEETSTAAHQTGRFRCRMESMAPSAGADPPFRLPDRDETIHFWELVSAARRMWPSNHLMENERQQEELCEQVEGEMGVDS